MQTVSIHKSFLIFDEIFYEKMREIYQQTLPAFEQILEERIDQYAEKIRASAQMDVLGATMPDSRVSRTQEKDQAEYGGNSCLS